MGELFGDFRWEKDAYCRAVEAACAEMGVKMHYFVGSRGGEMAILQGWEVDGVATDPDATDAAFGVLERAKVVCRALKGGRDG